MIFTPWSRSGLLTLRQGGRHANVFSCCSYWRPYSCWCLLLASLRLLLPCCCLSGLPTDAGSFYCLRPCSCRRLASLLLEEVPAGDGVPNVAGIRAITGVPAFSAIPTIAADPAVTRCFRCCWLCHPPCSCCSNSNIDDSCWLQAFLLLPESLMLLASQLLQASMCLLLLKASLLLHCRHSCCFIRLYRWRHSLGNMRPCWLLVSLLLSLSLPWLNSLLLLLPG